MTVTDLPATLSVDAAARLLGISRATAYTAVHDGDIPSVRVRKRILVPTHRLVALLDGEPSEKGHALVPPSGGS
jgi:excisionase family DNA binding protein